MANRKAVITPVEGETRIGGERPGIRGVYYIMSNVRGQGSVLALDAVSNAGVTTTNYLFYDSNGTLRTSTTFPSNTNTDGSVVGSQS